MISQEQKKELIKKFAKSENDTGSAEIQMAVTTARINQISNHLKSFPKDEHSRLGLVKLVGKRKRLTKYLKKQMLFPLNWLLFIYKKRYK